MAKDVTPSTRTDAQRRAELAARRKSAEEEAYLREVDEAVRADDLKDFGTRYGKPLAIGVAVLVAALAAFFLWWQPTQRAEREARSENLVSALDQLQAGNLDAADERLAGLEEGGDAAAFNARLLRAAIAAQRGETAEALTLYDAVAKDSSVPEPVRALATVRWAATGFDTLDKDAIVAALRPFAVPGEPFFASAGELMAMAHLEAGRERQAGELFAQIAQDDDAPESLKSRARQMAGVLGIDAIENIDELLEEQGVTAEAQPATP